VATARGCDQGGSPQAARAGATKPTSRGLFARCFRAGLPYPGRSQEGRVGRPQAATRTFFWTSSRAGPLAGTLGEAMGRREGCSEAASCGVAEGAAEPPRWGSLSDQPGASPGSPPCLTTFHQQLSVYCQFETGCCRMVTVRPRIIRYRQPTVHGLPRQCHGRDPGIGFPYLPQHAPPLRRWCGKCARVSSLRCSSSQSCRGAAPVVPLHLMLPHPFRGHRQPPFGPLATSTQGKYTLRSSRRQKPL